MVVNYLQYSNEKFKFFKKHKNNFEVTTSQMDEYGKYNKTYAFKDGSCWYEIMSPEYVTETVEIKLAKITIEVKMFRTEFFSSDDSTSKYYYEKF